MRHTITIAAAALLAAGLAPAIALAASASAEQVGSVTILRGGGTTGSQTAPAEVGSGSSNGPATARIEQSADWNAVHTGSGNAGGFITNPPPGAGR